VNVFVRFCVYTLFRPDKFYNEASLDYRLIAHLFAEFALYHTYVYVYSYSATDILTIPFLATIFVDKLSSN